MFKKLHIRLTVVCTLVTGLVLMGMALASQRYSERQFLRQAQESFDSNLNAIFFYLTSGTAIDNAWISQTEADNGLVIVIQEEGVPLLYNRNNPQRFQMAAHAQEAALEEYGFDINKAPSSSLQADVARFTWQHEGAAYRAAVCTVPLGESWLGVTVLKSTANERGQVLRLRWTFAGFVFAAVICLLAFAYLFTARAIRPVEESRRRQTEFVSSASHELRSPLAVMQASAGAIQTASLEEARHFAKTIDSECTRLSRLTSDLLALAGADNSRWSMEFTPTEPETLLLSVGERFEALCARQGQKVALRLPEEPLPRCRCDPHRVDQLLTILMDNAVSYTPPGGTIRLSAGVAGRKIFFSVEDSGPGVPDDQKDLIFQRFYRGDASRSKREHYGLGLSIAREIARFHKGTLTVTDSDLGGACFTLCLDGKSHRKTDS